MLILDSVTLKKRSNKICKLSTLWKSRYQRAKMLLHRGFVIQILTALRGTVKIIRPRWCQNHDYARSKAEGIVMVLTSPRTYNFKLCPELKAVNICFIYRMKGTQLQFKVLLIFTEFLPNNLKMHTAPAACVFRVITARKHCRVCRCDFDTRNTTSAQLWLAVPRA